MQRRPLLLTWVGVGFGLSVLLCGLVLWGVTSSYEWDLGRCRSLPDHYVPEFFWLFLIGPIGFVAMLLTVAAALMGFWGRPTQSRRPWVALAIGLVVVGAGLILAGLGIFGPCPSLY